MVDAPREAGNEQETGMTPEQARESLHGMADGDWQAWGPDVWAAIGELDATAKLAGIEPGVPVGTDDDPEEVFGQLQDAIRSKLGPEPEASEPETGERTFTVGLFYEVKASDPDTAKESTGSGTYLGALATTGTGAYDSEAFGWPVPLHVTEPHGAQEVVHAEPYGDDPEAPDYVKPSEQLFAVRESLKGPGAAPVPDRSRFVVFTGLELESLARWYLAYASAFPKPTDDPGTVDDWRRKAWGLHADYHAALGVAEVTKAPEDREKARRLGLAFREALARYEHATGATL